MTNRLAQLRLILAAGAAASILAPLTPAALAQAADIDLSRVTLYRSGVGFFEMRGNVQDDADVTLTFDAGQINDILKSLVLLDLSGGQIEAVGYDSDEPLSKRLAGFGLDISDNPSLQDILARLRGERVRIATLDSTHTGTVLGTEKRTIAEDQQSIEQWFVTLLTDQGVIPLRVSAIDRLEILNDKLASELNLALAAMAKQRGADRRGVDLRFRGAGARQVVVGYVHESPVWKTSYRLVLPESEGSPAQLQGWAIVENTTNDDWEDVTLSLVSGRPVSFTMDLADPVFLDRPSLPVPVEIAAAPEEYEAVSSPARKSASSRRLSGRISADRPQSEMASGDSYMSFDGMADYAPAPQATAQEIGEVFQYTLDLPVTIERQRSAMLPILSAPVEARRVSIYRTNDGSPHPMRGAEITNSSGLRLLPGPISVFDSGDAASAYTGDATITHIAEDEDRLLSYAVDLDVTVSTELDQTQRIDRVSIVRGTLIRQLSREWTQRYTVSNVDQKRNRTIILETPKAPGWDLQAPSKPTDTTNNTERFEIEVAPGGSEELEIVRTRTDRTSVDITSFDLGELQSLSRQGKVSRDVLNAAQKARDLQAAVNAAQQRVNDLERERNEITSEQDRIRQNMEAVSDSSSLYKRYLDKLNDQEDRFEQLGREIDDARRDYDRRLEALRSFIAGLGDIA